MSNLQSRLQKFIACMDRSVLSFENECGIAPGTVSKMTDKSRLRTLEKISRAFPQLNMDWLKTGEGEMIRQPGAGAITQSAVHDAILATGRSKINMKISETDCDESRSVAEIASLRAENADLSRQNAELRERLADKESTIAALRDHISTLNDHINLLKK